MAVARVVTFDGVNSDRVQQMQQEMSSGEAPPEVPATEIIMLHDPETERATVILFFENDEDYARGDAALNAMSAGDTPGTRTGVTKHQVAVRMSTVAR